MFKICLKFSTCSHNGQIQLVMESPTHLSFFTADCGGNSPIEVESTVVRKGSVPCCSWSMSSRELRAFLVQQYACQPEGVSQGVRPKDLGQQSHWRRQSPPVHRAESPSPFERRYLICLLWLLSEKWPEKWKGARGNAGFVSWVFVLWHWEEVEFTLMVKRTVIPWDTKSCVHWQKQQPCPCFFDDCAPLHGRSSV